jgi:hypothetical protein
MPETRLGEWFCRHGRCAVRAVLLRLCGGGALPTLRCPLCLRALAFGGWLPLSGQRSAVSAQPEERLVRLKAES